MAKPDFSAHALERLLDQRFLHRGPLRQLAEGEESRAFAFDAEDANYVVRISSRAEGFETDRLAHAALRGSNIPVPEVVAILPLGAQFACISRQLPGQTLQALPEGHAYACGPAVARMLDELAAADAGALDYFASSRLLAGTQSWPDFVGAVAHLNFDRTSPGLRAQLARWTELVLRHVPTLPLVQGLVHGDFGSNNMLVKDGAVTGVLDWSEARIGDPLYDVANILFWRSWLDCMEQQSRYFEAEAPQMLAEEARLRVYQMRIGLAVLNDAMRDGDAPLAEWTTGRLADIAAGR